MGVEVNDDWARAISCAVKVIRGYAVEMQAGEVPMLRGPLALLNVANVIEDTQRKHPPVKPDITLMLTEAWGRGYQQAVDVLRGFSNAPGDMEMLEHLSTMLEQVKP